MTYWREEPLEVDAVIDGSWGSWVIEVKTGSLTSGELKGIGEFVRRHPKYRPLVVCDDRPVRSSTAWDSNRSSVPTFFCAVHLSLRLDSGRNPATYVNLGAHHRRLVRLHVRSAPQLSHVAQRRACPM